MPRNSTGNYSLPLPPVVPGELIEAAWANTTLDDIGQALTDSLDRYGRGGMLAAFLFADGTVSSPGAAWANAPGTGFYRATQALGFSWNGEQIFNYNSNGISVEADKQVFVSTVPDTVNSLVNKAYVDGNFVKYTGGAVDAPITLKEGVSWLRYIATDNAEKYTIYIEGGDLKFNNTDGTGIILQYENANGFWYSTQPFFFKDGTGPWFAGEDGQLKWRLQTNGVAGNDSVGFYNTPLGKFALSLDPTNNWATFDNGVSAPGYQVHADWGGIQFYDAGGTKVGEFFGRPDGGMTAIAYDANGANGATLDILSNSMLWNRNFEATGYIWGNTFNVGYSGHAPLIYESAAGVLNVRTGINSDWRYFGFTADGDFQANNGSLIAGRSVYANSGYVRASDSERYTTIGQVNSAAWPSVQFYWAGQFERILSMDGGGSLRISSTADVSQITQVFMADGTTRSKQFVATANP